ncbi:MAG: DUF460 domain-containing protein [Candidatus Micrarchaeota archaeon]|nr:DUF460 domain-containing protein [Candidatus Micrarchaeota archaeon]
MSSYLIAGIDPGNTYGIAILSLDGRKVALRSTEGGSSDAVKIIERSGTPSLIACDVSPPPESVQKIASYFSCRLFSPPREIREEEKKSIASSAGARNNHERDAYCAAVFAYRSFQNKLRQIDALQELSQEEKERLKHLLLKGYRLKDAFLVLGGPQPKGGEAGAQQVALKPQRQKSEEELRKRIAELARENANLRLHIERLEGERARLQEKIRLLENGVRRSLLKDAQIRQLRFSLEQALRKRGEKRKAGDPSSNKLQEAESGDKLNNLRLPNLDLEKIVAEYRKGRKQL